jgi:hypothetical protein
MTDTQSRIIKTAILILLLAAGHSVLAAPPIKVESANPSEAPQDTPVLPIRIGGGGFLPSDGEVTAVRFTLPGCTEPPDKRDLCPTGDVTVTDFTVIDRKTIDAVIKVGEFAIVDFRDIEVEIITFSGDSRGGKGTTLFSVKEKNSGGPAYTTCTDAYFPGRPGVCTDMDGNECDLSLGNPDRIKQMIEDCRTKETIVLPNTGSLISDANLESPADYKTLTAAFPFTGTSVIANAGHRATVRALKIEIEPGIATGCDSGLGSAVHFVLDGSGITELPDPNDPNRASLLYVNAVHLTTAPNSPLCEPIVVARNPAYTEDTGGTTNDWKIYVSGNHIPPAGYSRTGIRFEGFKQQQDINPPRVDANVVGAPDCMNTGSAVGISYGPLIGRDFDPSSEALIESNTVTMSGATGCTGTVGILILGGGDTDMDGNTNNNAVIGGDVGVMIDASAGTDSVNMKGNTLTGDGGAAAVSSNICVGSKGKPNLINGTWGTDSDLPPNCNPL